MRSKRTAVAMIAAAGAMLLATATGVAAAQQESPFVYCPHQSPDKRGGECKGTKSYNDMLGTEFNDRIAALGSNDRVNALRGDDRVEGGPGDDSVFGGGGDDALYGGEGRDMLRDEDPFRRNSTDPSYTPPPDTDRVYGGADNDFIDVHDGDTDDVVSCGKGRDTVRFDKIGTDSDKLGDCEVRYANPD
jgi:Ca2+-binding RTX toxin-like protein